MYKSNNYISILHEWQLPRHPCSSCTWPTFPVWASSIRLDKPLRIPVPGRFRIFPGFRWPLQRVQCASLSPAIHEALLLSDVWDTTRRHCSPSESWKSTPMVSRYKYLTNLKIIRKRHVKVKQALVYVSNVTYKW